jgi:flagellar basal-body rod modification protein FlgD
VSISTSDILSSINQVAETSGTTTKSGFDGSDFMLVLLAQLKNQNPLEPLKDNEMMAQMAQLNSLQALQSIKSSMDQMAAANSASFAASLVGKLVKATLDDGSTVEGVVTSTSIKEGKYLLNVGDKSIYLAAITNISQPPAVVLAASATPDQTPPAPVASSVSKAT